MCSHRCAAAHPAPPHGAWEGRAVEYTLRLPPVLPPWRGGGIPAPGSWGMAIHGAQHWAEEMDSGSLVTCTRSPGEGTAGLAGAK